MESKEIFEWLQSRTYQTDIGEQEYRMYYALDMPKILEDYYEWKVKKISLNLPVMQSLILASLRERSKVYQDNYYAVGLDEVEREGWYASWKAMDEAIYIVEHAKINVA